MPIITLLTDFGMTDPYVGILKGAILSVNPAATLVDLTHEIPPQDILKGARILADAYAYFPPGTIHLAVVDPGVGGTRKIVAMDLSGHRFLTPDNGLLTLLLSEENPARTVSVDNSRFFRSPVSRTFHGRDIFAPVAGHLSLGVNLGELGPSVNPETLIRLPLPPVTLTGTEIRGTILDTDRFGNLITDIRERDIDMLCGDRKRAELLIEVGNRRISGVSVCYDSAPAGQILALIGSTGRLEISVNCGSAANRFGIQPGTPIRVCLPKE